MPKLRNKIGFDVVKIFGITFYPIFNLFRKGLDFKKAFDMNTRDLSIFSLSYDIAFPKVSRTLIYLYLTVGIGNFRRNYRPKKRIPTLYFFIPKFWSKLCIITQVVKLPKSREVLLYLIFCYVYYICTSDYSISCIYIEKEWKRVMK